MVEAKILGGPQDGAQIALPELKPVIEWLVLPSGSVAFIGSHGEDQPDNIETWVDRYIHQGGTTTMAYYQYEGRFRNSYYA